MSYLLPSYPLVYSFTGDPASFIPPQANIYLLKTDTTPPSLWYSTGRNAGDIEDITFSTAVATNTDLNTIVGNGTPSNSIGQNQNIYIDLSNFHYFIKTAGVWIDQGEITGTVQGPQGIPGTQGPRGNEIRSYAGVPTISGDELDNDLGINTITYDLYKFSSFTNTWAVIGNIKGEQGIQGEEGSTISVGLNFPTTPAPKTGDIFISTASGDLPFYQYDTVGWNYKSELRGPTGLGLSFQGIYFESSQYKLNDIVRYVPNNQNYIYTDTTAATGEIPGTSPNWELFGQNGDNGEDGNNAYTFLTTDFIQPAKNATVDIEVENPALLFEGLLIAIEGGGYYLVTDASALTTIEIQNLGYSSNALEGADVITSSIVLPAGQKGNDGTIVFVQAGLPSLILGNEEDLYIDTDTSSIYVKQSGAWVLKKVLGEYNYSLFNIFEVAINSRSITPAPTNPTQLVLDAEASNVFNYVLTETPTNISVTNLFAGWTAKLRLAQDSSGGNNVIFGSQFVYPGGLANVIKPSTIGGRDAVYSLVSFDGLKVHIDGVSLNYS